MIGLGEPPVHRPLPSVVCDRLATAAPDTRRQLQGDKGLRQSSQPSRGSQGEMLARVTPS